MGRKQSAEAMEEVVAAGAGKTIEVIAAGAGGTLEGVVAAGAGKAIEGVVAAGADIKEFVDTTGVSDKNTLGIEESASGADEEVKTVSVGEMCKTEDEYEAALEGGLPG